MEKMVSHNKIPKVSVIMLIHNREEYINESISSILNQDFDDFEFIIINNGSTDNSGEIAKKITKNDDRVRYIELETSHIGIGRNKGIDLARGEYIIFIDDDDIANSDMISFLYNLVSKNKADISICGSTKLVDGEVLPNYIFDEIVDMTPQEAVIEMLKRKKYNVAMPTKMISKKLFEKIRFLESGNYDDISVGYKYLANANKVIAHGLPKYCFRRHANNNSSFTTNYKLINSTQLDEYILAFRERTEYLTKLFPELEDYVRYSEWSYMISMCDKIEINNLKDCERQLGFFKKELKTNYSKFYNSIHIQQFEIEFMKKYIGEP